MKSILVSEHNTFLAGSHRRKLEAGGKNGHNCQSGLIRGFFRLTLCRAEAANQGTADTVFCNYQGPALTHQLIFRSHFLNFELGLMEPWMRLSHKEKGSVLGREC